MNSYVQVPFSYFVQSAKRDYSFPRDAFFREFLQNSVDAKSKNIFFKLYELEGKIHFECQDDGCGMDEDIIRNKLLVLGETSKGEGSTGGFGVAKILIYFAHPSYKIYTRDLIVTGSGGNYRIEKSAEFVAGTRAVVEINRNVIESDLDVLLYGLRTEIGRSYLPHCNISVNDKKVDAVLKRGRQVVDLGDVVIYKKNLPKMLTKLEDVCYQHH